MSELKTKLNIIYSYVYDFLSILYENIDLLNKIDSIILFGSVAQKTYDQNSDIDLFINLKNLSEKKTVEAEIKAALTQFEIKCENTWTLKQIDFIVKPIIGRLDENRWKGLQDEISSTAVVLFGQYNFKPDNLKHYALLTYSLNELKQGDKMNLIRKLYGYSIKKEKKEYKMKGLLEMVGGLKINANTILLPVNQSNEIRKLFDKFKTPIKFKEVWIK